MKRKPARPWPRHACAPHRQACCDRSPRWRRGRALPRSPTIRRHATRPEKAEILRLAARHRRHAHAKSPCTYQRKPLAARKKIQKRRPRAPRRGNSRARPRISCRATIPARCAPALRARPGDDARPRQRKREGGASRRVHVSIGSGRSNSIMAARRHRRDALPPRRSIGREPGRAPPANACRRHDLAHGAFDRRGRAGDRQARRDRRRRRIAEACLLPA